MRPTERQWRQAEEAGESARRAGRPRTSCPLYGHGEYGELMREAWCIGHDRQDARARGVEA